MPENCAAIVIAAKHHELIKVKDVRGTTNTIGALRCKFHFRTDDWLHSAKTAMFCNGDAILHPEVIDGAISVPLDADDECPVPYEVLTDTLPYSIGVWGVTNKGFRIVSNWLVFNTQYGCYTEGNAPEDPDQTVYDEILLIANDAVNKVNEIVQRVNNGELDGKSAYEIACSEGFVGSQTEWISSLTGDKGDKGEQGIQGEKGEKGDKGDKGNPGYTPIKGVDYFDGKDGAQGPKGDKGDKGDKGSDGYTPIKGVDYFDGKDGNNGYTPVKGKDYFTLEDISEIVDNVIEQMPERPFDDIADAIEAVKTYATNQDAVVLAEAQAYTDKKVAEGGGSSMTEEQIAKLDSALQTITAGIGLKATQEDTNVSIDFDEEVVFVFDCGTADILVAILGETALG